MKYDPRTVTRKVKPSKCGITPHAESTKRGSDASVLIGYILVGMFSGTVWFMLLRWLGL